MACLHGTYPVSYTHLVFVAMLKEYAAEVGKEFLPDVYPLIEKDFKGDYQAYVDDFYARSSLKTPHGFEQVVKGDTTCLLYTSFFALICLAISTLFLFSALRSALVGASRICLLYTSFQPASFYSFTKNVKEQAERRLTEQ